MTEIRSTADFETTVVEPSFGPAQYAAVFERLQAGEQAKVLDLRAASVIGMDLFARLAATCEVPADRVPRLAILLRYDSWALLETMATPLLLPITERGIAVTVCYAQQAEFLPAWFAGEPLRHNVPAAVRWLAKEWRPTSLWPAILRTTAELVRRLVEPDEAPPLFVDLAEVALSAGRDGAAEALGYLATALRWMHWQDEPLHPTRCRALRLLAVTATYAGDVPGALEYIEQAFLIAQINHNDREAAEALLVSACCLRLVGQLQRAERQLHLAADYIDKADDPRLRAALNEQLAAIGRECSDKCASRPGREAQEGREP